jgi:hypothetical protein
MLWLWLLCVELNDSRAACLLAGIMLLLTVLSAAWYGSAHLLPCYSSGFQLLGVTALYLISSKR